MSKDTGRIEQYMALALQPVMVGAQTRADITRNLDHIAELAFAAKNVTEIEQREKGPGLRYWCGQWPASTTQPPHRWGRSHQVLHVP